MLDNKQSEQDPYCDKNKGLFIYHSSGGCATNHSREIDIENAEGKWNWQIDYTLNVPVLGGTTPILSTITRNVNTGYEEYGKQVVSGSYSPVLINDDPCSSDSNDYFITWDDKGDEMDAYNIGYDEIFSPYSNPASNTCSNPTANSGLTINLVSQDTSGAITLDIYYENSDALSDLPPSKPKNIKVTKSFYGDGTFHPKITWDQNIEPDFYNASSTGPGEVEPKYEIYRGDSTVCDMEPTYTLITTLASNVTEYTDNGVSLFDADNAIGETCYDEWTTYSYKVVAKDNNDKRSLKSERGLVSGYTLCPNPGSKDNLFFTENNELPEKFSVNNYPNPFNPETKINYELPNDVFVKIIIYDALGREVKIILDEFKVAGRYNVTFRGESLPSGVYYYRFSAKGEAGNFMQTKKMLLLK